MGLRLPLHNMNLTHLVRLVIGQQFREGQVVPSQWIDAVEHDPSGHAVVTVGSVEVVRAVRALGDDEIRPPLADLSGDVPPELARVLDVTIAVAEELDVPHPEHLRGIPLLRFADLNETIACHRAVAGPHAAICDDDVNGSMGSSDRAM